MKYFKAMNKKSKDGFGCYLKKSTVSFLKLKHFVRNMIFLQIRVFDRYIKETTLIWCFIKVTAQPSFSIIKID